MNIKRALDYIAPGHCTGEPTFSALQKVFGDRYLYAGLGTTRVRANPRAASIQDGAPVLDDGDSRSYRTLLAQSDDLPETGVGVVASHGLSRSKQQICCRLRGGAYDCQLLGNQFEPLNFRSWPIAPACPAQRRSREGTAELARTVRNWSACL